MSDRPQLFFPPDVIPSQYMRQLIAGKVGCGEQWNWRQHWFLDEMQQTIKRLEHSFSNLNDC